MSDDAGELDREYGRRLKGLREAQGLTQADVVRRMKAGGLTYMNASTLSRIESGQRPLRLSEADVLSAIYAFPLSMLTLREPSFERANMTKRHLSEARGKIGELRRIASEIIEYQVQMPGLAQGLDLIYERSTDEDLIRQLDRLKRRMQEFAAIDLAAEMAEIQEHAQQDLDRAWRRIGRRRSDDGEHQTEA